jgi:hypothetical protein
VADSEHTDITWHKSMASGQGGSNCVEVAIVDESVLVRNSRDPLGPVLSFSRQEWAAFLQDVTNREFTVDRTSSGIL